MSASFSPCGRRCRSEAQVDEGLSAEKAPHPSRRRFASIADAKHRRYLLSADFRVAPKANAMMRWTKKRSFGHAINSLFARFGNSALHL